MNNQNSSENILEIKNIEVVYDDVILAISDVSLNVEMCWNSSWKILACFKN